MLFFFEQSYFIILLVRTTSQQINISINTRGDFLKLEILEHPVNEVLFGDRSKYSNGILILNKEEFSRAILSGTYGDYKLEIQIARPKEDVRIIHITDVIKPSYKPNGPAFPGWTGSTDCCGSEITHQLQNVCITQCFSYSGIQEGIMDMKGKETSYVFFSQLINIVIRPELLTEKIEKKDVASDLVRMNTQAAEYTASLAADSSNAAGTLFDTDNATISGLPNIGYAYYIQAQGPLRNVYIWGKDCTKMKPCMISPVKVLDGAIVSGNYIIACQKNPTYFHQENPVIRSLLARDKKELNFAGVIVSTESSALNDKRENAQRIAEIAKEKGMDGIVITQEGGGHADVDLMLACDACESAGIRVVLIANEIAGPEGNLPPLVSMSSKADAIITTGNNDEILHFPETASSLGGTVMGTRDASEEFDSPLSILYTATNQLGVSKMTTKQF